MVYAQPSKLFFKYAEALNTANIAQAIGNSGAYSPPVPGPDKPLIGQTVPVVENSRFASKVPRFLTCTAGRRSGASIASALPGVICGSVDFSRLFWILICQTDQTRTQPRDVVTLAPSLGTQGGRIFAMATDAECVFAEPHRLAGRGAGQEPGITAICPVFVRCRIIRHEPTPSPIATP